jgi:hypothetical protein
MALLLLDCSLFVNHKDGKLGDRDLGRWGNREMGKFHLILNPVIKD